MPSRDDLINIAAKEEGVGILTNPKRVAEYFASYPAFAGKTEQAMLKVSWCQIYINWVLLKAGYPLFQRTFSEWTKNAKDNVDDGFQYVFKPKGSGYKPKPGDIYYSPIVRHKNTEHMGFVIQDRGNGYYRTLDGNAGGPGHVYYDDTLWGGKKSGALVGGLGGGVVCFNERHDNGGSDLKIAGFIPLPAMIYIQNPYG